MVLESFRTCHRNHRNSLLLTGSEEREVLGVWSIPVAILPVCQYMKVLHHNHIDINMVG